MYWFRIFYYDASDNNHVKPIMNTDGDRMLIYASTPEQATDVAWVIMNEDPSYWGEVGIMPEWMSSAVHEDDEAKWYADHNV